MEKEDAFAAVSKNLGHSRMPQVFVIIAPSFAACQYILCHFSLFLHFKQVRICDFMQDPILQIAKCSGMIKAQRRDLLFKDFQNFRSYKIETSNI